MALIFQTSLVILMLQGVMIIFKATKNTKKTKKPSVGFLSGFCLQPLTADPEYHIHTTRTKMIHHFISYYQLTSY